MNEEKTPRVTGKQILTDAVTLFKDTGIFIYDVTRLAIDKIKASMSRKDGKENKDEIQASVPVQ
ncbi:MAG: hypothetical protein HDT28_02850 [Clostridiales bacterium]|nr:hypothetical protein [Clostridiales bacterium]